jgi:hypothetical protein
MRSVYPTKACRAAEASSCWVSLPNNRLFFGAVGVEGIPSSWRSGLIEWPRSLDWMERLGRQLEEGTGGRSIELSFFSLLIRNVGFLAIVIFHGFRRLLPF